ncbi:hypothetical protein ACJ2A9_00775 [Anaerobacillus sp. MEB173]|uniref:hypothetical protein n=1 Tax=Anaerobacillus sp. MEB173 TaxID=3383345 RepID=UPI003F909FDF
MKQFFTISAIMIHTIVLLTSCSTGSNENEYYVVVVEGAENMIDTFDEYVSFENPIIEIDYYKRLTVAQQELSKEKIDAAPIALLYKKKKEAEKKLLLKTNDLKEFQKVLKELKNKGKLSVDLDEHERKVH